MNANLTTRESWRKSWRYVRQQDHSIAHHRMPDYGLTPYYIMALTAIAARQARINELMEKQAADRVEAEYLLAVRCKAYSHHWGRLPG